MNRKERKERKEADAEPKNELSQIHGRTTGDPESPVAGEKPVSSERERSLPAVFSSADVPEARRFCLSSFPPNC